MRYLRPARRLTHSIQVLGIALLNFAFSLYLSKAFSGIAVIFWLLAIGLFLLSCRYMDDESGGITSWAFRWTPFDWLACTVIFAVALFLRLIDVGTAPFTLHNDEARMGLYTAALIAEPTAHFYTYDEFSTTKLWYYLLALGMLFKGQTQAAIRIVPAFLGAFAIIPTYLFARLLFCRTVAIVAILLLATYHFHIHFSRVAVNNITDPLWGVMIYGTLYVALGTRRRFLYGLTGVLIGISLHFYTGARLFLPLTVVAWLFWWFATWQAKDNISECGSGHGTKKREVLCSASLISIGLLLAAGLVTLSTLREPFWFLTRLQLEGLNAEWVDQTMADNSWSYFQFWWEQVSRSALPFFIYGEAGYGNYYDVEKPLLSIAASMFFAMGLLLSLARIRTWPSQLLLAWIVLTILFGGVLLRNPPAVQRYVTLTVPIVLLIAISLQTMHRWFCDSLPQFRPLWWGLFVVAVLYLSATGISRYFGDYLSRETYGTRKSQAATLIGRHLLEQPANTQVIYLGQNSSSYFKSSIPRFLAHHLDEQNIYQFDSENEASYFLRPNSLLDFGEQPTLLLIQSYDKDSISAIELQYSGATHESLIWPPSESAFVEVFALNK